jgi:hypothetical protein
MNVVAYIAIVLFVAVIVAMIIARKSIKELIAFLKMDNNEKEQAIEKMKKYAYQRSALRGRKVSGNFSWVLFFFGLSAICGLVGLDYSCGYSAFWGAMILSEAIDEQVKLFIANYGNPNELDGEAYVFEFRAAA